MSSSLHSVMSKLMELSATASNPILQIIELVQISLDSFSRILAFQATGGTYLGRGVSSHGHPS